MPFKHSIWQRLLAADQSILRITALVVVLATSATLAWSRWRPAVVHAPTVAAATDASASASADQRQRTAALADTRAAEAETASRAAEATADAAETSGDHVAALAARREALRRQDEANRLRASNPPSAIQRRSDLATRIARAEYAARLGDFSQMLARAEALSPSDARAALAAARHLAQDLGPRPPGLVDDPLKQLSDLEARLATRFSRQLHAESVAREAAAAVAADSGHYAEAAEIYARALQIQETINELHATGAYANFPRARALELRRDECLAQPLLQEIATCDQALTVAQRTDAPETVHHCVEQLDTRLNELRRQFPDLGPRYGDLVRRLDLVRMHRGEIAGLRQRLLDRSIPLPGSEARRLLQTPVDQDIFSLITHDNPSRQPDPRRPVDSVTAQEAIRFCQRLGWLLGLKVSLPTPTDANLAPISADFSEWLANSSPEEGAPPYVLSKATRDGPVTMAQPPRSRRHTFRLVFSPAE